MSGAARIEPLTPDRWEDLERLFSGRRVVDGCWCMFWRQTGRENRENWGERNRDAFARRVSEGDPAPGLLAYDGDEPIGWVAVAPLPEFGRILRSPTLRPLGNAEGVWSINCFYVVPDARGDGLLQALLDAAVDHARAHGADAVQAYPVDTDAERVHPDELFTGTSTSLAAAGFTEVARRSDRRPVVQIELEP